MVLAEPARQLAASKQDAGRQWPYHFGLSATGSDRLHVQRVILLGSCQVRPQVQTKFTSQLALQCISEEGPPCCVDALSFNLQTNQRRVAVSAVYTRSETSVFVVGAMEGLPGSLI